MLKEVLVVEGKMDVFAINRAVEADSIITGGFTLSEKTMKNIEVAYKKRGIIILTDPDSAGERIRRFLTKKFPKASHAFIPKEEATANDDIGVEQASPDAIRKALKNAHEFQPSKNFTSADVFSAELAGGKNASLRRARVGEILGIGFSNAKTFLRRLNNYGITREEFDKAVSSLGQQVEIS